MNHFSFYDGCGRKACDDACCYQKEFDDSEQDYRKLICQKTFLFLSEEEISVGSKKINHHAGREYQRDDVVAEIKSEQRDKQA